MSILGKKLILVTYLAVFALGGLAFNWSDWHLTSASKQALTLLDISPSVLSLKHEAQDIASDLKDSVALVFDYLEQRQQTVALSRIAGESLDNNSPQPPLNLRETPSLTSRRGLGDSALGEAGELYPQEVTKVIREVNNYTLKASLTEQELLDLISASDQLKQMLKGEKGDKGEQGSQGPAGAGITYSSPNIQNPGSFGGITYFGAKDIRTETINATSTATLNSLTVTNGGTLSGQLTITRVPSVAHVFTTWPSGVSGVSDSSIYINPASATADSNLLGLAVNGTVKFLVDAEGDIYGNNLVLSGSTSQGQTTIAGNLTVQDSTTFGDASTDTLTFTAVSNSNLTFKKADPSLILDVTTATDTDFWLGVQDDAGSDDDDTFQIGDGITPGTNTFLTLDTSGNLTLSSLTASRLVFTDANKALSSSSSSSIVAASLSDETGSGVLVFSTSPTLVTPALGTPSALVGTNITGTASGLTAGNVTTNANLTGPITSVGNATSIAAQTGTGTTFVMNTSPTLVTPVLGVATATSIAIGANTLDTTEWANLDGLNQTLATTSSPTFNALTVTSCTGCSPTTSAALAAAITDETGSGALVFANTPTLVTPTLGVATATTINKVTITTPATGSTLTIADGKTLTASNTLTFTGTDSSSVAFGTGGTVAYTANNLSVFAATTSLQLLGVMSDETGSGALVFANTPTLVTPVLGAATGTSLALGGGTALTTTNQTGTGSLVLATSPSITTPTISGGTHTGLTSLGIRSTGTGALDLTIANTENLTAGRTLTITTGDAARTITLSGNPTLNDWFDQSVKVAASPTFAGATFSSDLVFSANSVIRRNTSDGSDNGWVRMEGGGASGSSRGSLVEVNGNESASPGYVVLRPGAVTGGSVRIIRSDSGLWYFVMEDSDGSATFTSSKAGQSAWTMNSTDANGSSLIITTSGNTVFKIGSTKAIDNTGTATTGGFVAVTWPTSGAAANAVLGDGDYLRRSTSSRRWKQDITYLTLDDVKDVVMGLRPVTYRGIGDKDSKRLWPGFIAEDVAEIEPLLATYDDGIMGGLPNYVTYDRIPAYLVPVIQDHESRLSLVESSLGLAVDNDNDGITLSNIKDIASISGKWSIDENGELIAQVVTVETGFNMKDQITGEYFCVTIKNGEFDKQAGKCGTQESGITNQESGNVAGESTDNTSNSELNSESQDGDPESPNQDADVSGMGQASSGLQEEEPSPEPEAQPDEESSSEPQPEPESAPEPAPEPSEEATP